MEMLGTRREKAGAWDQKGWGPAAQVLPATTQPFSVGLPFPTNRLTPELPVPRGSTVGSGPSTASSAGALSGLCMEQGPAHGS